MGNIKQKLFDDRVLSNGNRYSWVIDTKFETIEAFTKEFKSYNEEIEGQFVEDFIVFAGCKINIRYQGAPADEAYQNLECEIKANGEEGISFIELMYQFNNCAHKYLADCDHHFFEGLRYIVLKDEILILSIRLGS